ncbi:MAG: GNAT family N-acyltransferase [Pseudomonadota bacterium]
MSAVQDDIPRRISIRAVADRSTSFGRRLFWLAPALDKLLGIDAMHRFAEQNQLYGLPPEEFATKALQGLGVDVAGAEALAERLPESGPTIIVANHPHGGIEGMVMVHLLAALRPDVKIMANTALRVFNELTPYFIFVNPLQPRHPSNARGLRESLKHLRNGGVLVMFPAGRTSFYQPDLKCIADAEWNRSVATLARKTNAHVLPMRFTGRNSERFYRLGAIWYRFRLLMLARELMKTTNRSINVVVGRAFPSKPFAARSDAEFTEILQTQSAALQPEQPPTKVAVGAMEPLIDTPDRAVIAAEIDALPAHQRVLDARGLTVGFGTRAQLPTLVEDIARERERTFRLLDEGSGLALDTDRFDDIYDHLFCWDTQSQALVGAYRIGRRDHLLANGGNYLAHVFDFDPAFFESRAPALELGRSFVTPEFQRSRHALDFLWRGIGGYLRVYPNYGTLYGTVSLTTQYDPVSIAMICDALIDETPTVKPRIATDGMLPAEWHRLRRRQTVDISLVNALVAAREADGKGLPVLLRHYAGLGAKFHAVGIDPNFARTPGLLLSVDLATLPDAKRRRYIDTENGD